MATFSDGVVITVAPSALKELKQYLRKEGFSLESGGVLLGVQSQGRLEFSIEHFTLPDKSDKRSRLSFLRRSKPANKVISAVWEETSGRVNYLGEWHTHDEERPVPSAEDRKLMSNVIDDESCLFDRAFMVIVGSDGCAFVGESDTRAGRVFMDTRYIDVWND